ncbi:MAG: stress response translation initiation inhibitor YciH [Thermoprotei archaeon]|nr:MAG: stress response translation initiation inhibitor YciH [Thermoprotei archaeon]
MEEWKDVVGDISSILGLPKELISEEELWKKQTMVRVRLEKRRRNKDVTIIEGIDAKSINLRRIATELKSKLACGGTVKNNRIELQGDHRERVKKLLVELGFEPENIFIE